MCEVLKLSAKVKKPNAKVAKVNVIEAGLCLTLEGSGRRPGLPIRSPEGRRRDRISGPENKDVSSLR